MRVRVRARARVRVGIRVRVRVRVSPFGVATVPWLLLPLTLTLTLSLSLSLSLTLSLSRTLSRTLALTLTVPLTLAKVSWPDSSSNPNRTPNAGKGVVAALAIGDHYCRGRLPAVELDRRLQNVPDRVRGHGRGHG